MSLAIIEPFIDSLMRYNNIWFVLKVFVHVL